MAPVTEIVGYQPKNNVGFSIIGQGFGYTTTIKRNPQKPNSQYEGPYYVMLPTNPVLRYLP